jgi:wyosine [tRNA(Phe)-imidazoG37] synthetase (radical SAM superfamily)
MPSDYKLCSFNCVYCHYGLTEQITMAIEKYGADLPALDDVVRELEEVLPSPVELDLITFSGNGEPTLHPSFPELVDAVVALRNRYQPEARVALLSNSTGLIYERVRKCISKLDLPVFKLDAGTEKTFRAMNRPAAGIHFEDIARLLCSVEDICLQTAFMDGKPSNISAVELRAYIEIVGRIRPRELHIYSIDRPVPNSRIKLVPPERLEEIAARIHQETGIEVRAFYPSRRS